MITRKALKPLLHGKLLNARNIYLIIGLSFFVSIGALLVFRDLERSRGQWQSIEFQSFVRRKAARQNSSPFKENNTSIRYYESKKLTTQRSLASNQVVYGAKLGRKVNVEGERYVKDGVANLSIWPTFPYPQKSSGKENDKNVILTKALCPLESPNLVGELAFRSLDNLPTLEEVAANNPSKLMQGFYEPQECTARHRVAVIIPHRGREPHLRALLWHLIPVLQRQQLRYKIYVVHQAGDQAFNKAKLMNLGFLEATREADFDCVVFHDVDLLPENDKLLYTCTATPKHMSVAIDKYNYKLPYKKIFGGVTMVTPRQFRDVHGFSNKYWGWGGEDDDIYYRLVENGFIIQRPPMNLGRYRMIFHQRDKLNDDNPLRMLLLSNRTKKNRNDGLENVIYSVVHIAQGPLYTNITANVGTAVLQCAPSAFGWRCVFITWVCRYLGLFCSMIEMLSTDEGTLVL